MGLGAAIGERGLEVCDSLKGMILPPDIAALIASLQRELEALRA
jgi:hypothetical protein